MKILPYDMSRCLGRRIPRDADEKPDICQERKNCLRYLTIERERDSLEDYRRIAFHTMLRGHGQEKCGDRVEVEE